MKKYRDAKFIFVVGIGGSDLASKAVWSALALHRTNIDKKIFFLEAPDSREYAEVEDFVKNGAVDPKDVALIVVSKSGETEETLETFHKMFAILSEKFGESIADRGLVISTEGTPLWKLAKEKKMKRLTWDDNIGGRFSAFTVAHTTVISLSGLDAEAFVQGGEEMAAKCENQKTEDNPAKKLAKNIFGWRKNGVEILDLFFFNAELEDLGKWCRQLIAESLSTITPAVSIGPTDLHSMLELYLGGPKNRYTIFVRSLREIENSVNEAAYENVLKTYEKEGLPFMKYEIESINEKELGSFMAFMMAMTVELAKLLKVNPYDQPAVDEYKKSLHNL